jgi:hypothetical protein
MECLSRDLLGRGSGINIISTDMLDVLKLLGSDVWPDMGIL